MLIKVAIIKAEKIVNEMEAFLFEVVVRGSNNSTRRTSGVVFKLRNLKVSIGEPRFQNSNTVFMCLFNYSLVSMMFIFVR